MELKHIKDEKGFTLVELAIVLVIVGLLIGGILKGQELITNAQISSTISQIKGIEAATNTFFDQHRAIPGDMVNAAGANGRLQNCLAAPCFNGDGSGRISQLPGAVAALSAANGAAGENTGFFVHLQRADLITSMDGTNLLAFGQALPGADIGGGFKVGHTNIGGAPTNVGGSFLAADFRSGHYLVLDGVANLATAAPTGVITPGQAARIDRKLDDGIPNSGSVLGENTPRAGQGCRVAAGGALYDEQTPDSLCPIAIRIRQ